MKKEEVVKKIKSKNWDNRVKRPGFFQSKQIVIQALTQRFNLSSSLQVHDTNNIWIRNSALYDQDYTDQLFNTIFPQAFAEDKNWPLAIITDIEKTAQKKEEFVVELSKTNWSKASLEEKISTVKKYVELLIDIQKYYAIAVPLTNYCEKFLKENDESLLMYAVQYKPLDVDRMNESLLQIKEIQKTKNKKEFEKLLTNHLQKFDWIKTNYNLIEEYTRNEVLTELKSDIHLFTSKKSPDSEYLYILTALQIGIYLRNRMKELSQHVWFVYEQLAAQLAKDISLKREDFLQLGWKEVIDSMQKGILVVDKKEIEERHAGFVVGILDNEEFILSGSVVDELSEYFTTAHTEGIKEIKGNIASKGFVVGVARVVANISEIGKLQDGDILVTSMTTPDFIIAMKKAGAIVTDEGGLSCHAAIVSREMKKPCIIGTKIATKVLKDGMKIEVDANIGIVKIL